MIAVLKNFSAPVKSLNKVKTMLSENGRIYVVVPHLRTDILAAPHLFTYTEDTITKLLNKTGFAVESME